MSGREPIFPHWLDVRGQRRLLAGFDRHSASHHALVVAADFARRLGASLVVVHVIDLADYPVDPDRDDWEASATRTLGHERAHAEGLLVEAPIQWTYETVRGDPARALAKRAHDLDVLFLVVGSSGRSLAHRLLHGSVPQSLCHRQPKPVLVVPAPSTLPPGATNAGGGLHLASR